MYDKLKRRYRYLGLIAIFVSLLSCDSGSGNQPDVASVNVRLDTRRLDKDLYALDTQSNQALAAGVRQLATRYPDYLRFYLDTIMGFQINGQYTEDNPALTEGLRSFLCYSDYRNLYDTIQKHYPDTRDIEEKLLKAFQYYKYYYPEASVPKIVYFSSGLNNWGCVYDGSVMGIGLDMFLGENYPFYASVGLSQYMYINFRKETIVPSVMSTIYNDLHPFRDEDQTLLSMMIQKGKQQYFLEKTVPFVSPADRIGYTPQQVEWCEKNEAMIYNFFLSNQLLFEKNWAKMRRYVVYGPNTGGMPAESPGNIGTWLGYRMVQSYMENNKDIALDKMFADENAEQFLKKAKYKPR